VTAADLLDGSGNPGRARVLMIAEIGAGAPAPGRWVDHLALWAERRQEALPLPACVPAVR
jgi:hypothetical protein